MKKKSLPTIAFAIVTRDGWAQILHHARPKDVLKERQYWDQMWPTMKPHRLVELVAREIPHDH